MSVSDFKKCSNEKFEWEFIPADPVVRVEGDYDPFENYEDEIQGRDSLGAGDL